MDDPPLSYTQLFGAPLTPSLRRLVERRLAAGPQSFDPLDELFEAAVPAVRAWMRRKAELADGTRPGIPLVDAESVEEVLARAKGLGGEWTVKLARRPADAWAIARVGLLRDLCGTTFGEMGRRYGCSLQGAYRLHGQHRSLLLGTEDYRERVEGLAGQVLSACHEL